jgi:hypothetical protein
MSIEHDLFPAFFLGVLGLASGVQIGWGLHHLRQRDWTSGGLVLLQGLFIPFLLLLLGDERFLPPSTSVTAWTIVAVIFVGSILAQVWLLPRLADDLGEETLAALTRGGGFVIGGLAFGFIAQRLDNAVTGVCGAILLVGVGLLWLVPGVRTGVRRALGARDQARAPHMDTLTVPERTHGNSKFKTRK